MANPINSDLMIRVKDIQKTVNDMQPRVRALEDWKTGVDAVDVVMATRKPIVSLSGVDWKAIIAIVATIAAAIYAGIKQVK